MRCRRGWSFLSFRGASGSPASPNLACRGRSPEESRFCSTESSFSAACEVVLVAVFAVSGAGSLWPGALASYLVTCLMMSQTAATVTTHRAAVDTIRQKSRLRRSRFQKLRRWEWNLTSRSGAGGGGTGTTLDMPSHITIFHAIGKCRMRVGTDSHRRHSLIQCRRWRDDPPQYLPPIVERQKGGQNLG